MALEEASTISNASPSSVVLKSRASRSAKVDGGSPSARADSPSHASVTNADLDRSTPSVRKSVVTAPPIVTTKSLKNGKRRMVEPKVGSFMKITNVIDIYKQVRILVSFISNVWGWRAPTTTLFRMVLPGLVRVHVGDETYTMPGFLLQDLDSMCTQKSQDSSYRSLGQVTDPSVQDIYFSHNSRYFPHVIVLVKLRWLLRLHSACCEMDYKMCSLNNLILGMQFVILQQYAEAAATDSIFNANVSESWLHLDSVLDDFIDQLNRSLGDSWRSFLEFVATCETSRCIHHSPLDLHAPQVLSNDALSQTLDTIFVASFLRQPRSAPASKLKELYSDLTALGIALPELPPLKRAPHLRAWAKAMTKPTRQSREKARGKEAEKLAQLDAVLLTAAVELRLPEVIASAEEQVDVTDPSDFATTAHSADVVPKALDFGMTGFNASGSAAPPAARVILVDKPQPAGVVLDAAVLCIHHHRTFPQGIRERLYGLLMEEYRLTKEQSERVAIAATQNIDGKRLNESLLLSMEHREKTRLNHYGAEHYKDISHLVVPTLVSGPGEWGKPAKYGLSKPRKEKEPSVDMSRSLPDLKDVHCKSRPRFKVPLQTGPLTMDHEMGKLRTTGFFMKMPPLDGGRA